MTRNFLEKGADIMTKTTLITGSTDGIGLETAKMLAQAGNRILLHGRNAEKLRTAQAAVAALSDGLHVETYLADLSRLDSVVALAAEVTSNHDNLDVLINNAGVYGAARSAISGQIDVRFVVNTVAPYLLTRLLFPILGSSSRVINLASAAQSPVDLMGMQSGARLSDGMAYAQSKRGLIMWSRDMARKRAVQGPAIISVNPASMLASKMVKDAYGVDGGDLRIGADILVRAAFSDEFADASGKYYDNDRGAFAPPEPGASGPRQDELLVQTIEAIIDTLTGDRGNA